MKAEEHDKGTVMSNLKPQQSPKIFLYCGILSPIISFLLISLAILFSPWWSWTENALSDLGVDGTTALSFNFGLILGAILFFTFILGGLKRFFQNQAVGRIGVFFLLLVAIFMLLIGVFPEPTPYQLHIIVSVGFFATLALSLVVLAAALLRMPSETGLGAFTLLLAIIAIAAWIIPNPWEGVAIPELVAGLAESAWSVTISIRLLKRGSLN